MTLYLIGIGLWHEKDISVRGLEVLRSCDQVYLESYTSRLGCSHDALEAFYGRRVDRATREMVEKQADKLFLEPARAGNVALLIIGDVFGATTHMDIMLRAKKEGVKVEVIHNASVLTAVGIIGLELYKYGRITSIPFHNKDVRSPVEVIMRNEQYGMHTLVLLDVDVERNRYMTVAEAVEYLLHNGLEADRVCVACAGLGAEQPVIRKAGLFQLRSFPREPKPQCIVIPAKLHFIEEEALGQWV